MSCYDEDGGDDLYPEPAQAPQSQPAGAAPQSSPVSSFPAPASPSPSDAVAESLGLIAAGPAELLAEVLPADPSQSKLPIGLAVLGACAAAVIWANSLDKKGRG